ncbi:MAG: tRNA-dihydrouridine synthase [Minisyncoccia bacterium]
MQSFWEGLPKPFFIQAPMEDVTDAAFRQLIARFGKPHVMFTEFTSADGLVLAPEEGRRHLLKKLEYSPEERPIVAQLFSAIPERMEAAAKLCAELGFDGIDINMGCPVDDVVKTGCGAALIKTPALARELIRAAQKSGLPVSVKTRIGYDKDELDTWLPELLAENLACVTIHARTRKEMSAVPARWDAVARAVAIRDKLGSKTLIVGNGDITHISDGRQRCVYAGCDGVMLGRAIYGNPWLYRDLHIRRTASLRGPDVSLTVPMYGSEPVPPAPRIASESATPVEVTDSAYVPTPQERISALIEHIKLFEERLGGFSNFATMKKHFKAYISGWDGAKDLRVRLMAISTAAEALAILHDVRYPEIGEAVMNSSVTET